MQRRFVLKFGHDGRIDVHQTKARMVGHDMTATDLAELAGGAFGLVERAYVFFTLRDAHAVGWPQAERIDRRGSLDRAVVAVAIPHRSRGATDFDFHRTTETASLIYVTYRDPPAD